MQLPPEATWAAGARFGAAGGGKHPAAAGRCACNSTGRSSSEVILARRSNRRANRQAENILARRRRLNLGHKYNGNAPQAWAASALLRPEGGLSWSWISGVTRRNVSSGQSAFEPPPARTRLQPQKLAAAAGPRSKLESAHVEVDCSTWLRWKGALLRRRRQSQAWPV